MQKPKLQVLLLQVLFERQGVPLPQRLQSDLQESPTSSLPQVSGPSQMPSPHWEAHTPATQLPLRQAALVLQSFPKPRLPAWQAPKLHTPLVQVALLVQRVPLLQVLQSVVH